MNAHDHVIADALYCAHLFRLGRDIEGALKMVDLIDATMPLFVTRSAEDQAQWTQVLGEILQCQERQDWIAVADWLEVELVACVSLILPPSKQ